MSIADDLVANLMVSYNSSEDTNENLLDLTGRMIMFFASGTANRLKEGPHGNIWNQYFSRDGVPAANVRIATLDMNSLLTDSPIYLRQSGQDPRYKDGGLNKQHSARPPVLNFNHQLLASMHRYLKRLFSNELAELVRITNDAVASGERRRAIVSLDFYSDRATNTSALHKDTAGITLFVVLHYVNPGEMLGPEFIHDKWPIGSNDGNHKYFTPFEKANTGDADKRFHAPWTKWGNTSYWPESLLEALEIARNQLPNDKTLHYVNLSAYGLVSFVDELVYHATPFNRSRSREDMKHLFRDVHFSSVSFKIFPDKLQRTLSVDFGNGKRFSMTGGADKRCFVRIWISVSPHDWYEKLVS